MASKQPKTEIPIDETGNTTKTIIREGKGARCYFGEKIAINFQIEDGKSNVIKSTFNNENPFTVYVDKNKIEDLTKMIVTMRVGEISQFHVRSPEMTLVYLIEVLYIIEPMKKEEAIAEANQCNTEGGNAFRSKQFSKAEMFYKEAIYLLIPYQDEEIKALLIKLRSNLSMVYSRMEKWNESLHWAENVLRDDQENLKCLMRKLDALVHLKQFNEALSLSQKCVEISKNDPVFVKKKNEIETQIKSQDHKQDDIYRKMFGNSK